MEVELKTVEVSADVFARVWSLRQSGEESEDQILRRVLGIGRVDEPMRASAMETPSGSKQPGFIDRRHGVAFPEGFEMSRKYLGAEYRARATNGHWLLNGREDHFESLNDLSKAVGARTENAWIGWFFIAADGTKRPVSDLRDPTTIVRHGRGSPSQTLIGDMEVEVSDGTWRDDVRTALITLGGRGRLENIYDATRRIRQQAGRSLPRTLEAVIRRTLEDHSSDSDNFRGTDLFCLPDGKGAGLWGLREYLTR